MKNIKQVGNGSPAVLVTDGAPTMLQSYLLDIRAERNHRLAVSDWTVNSFSGDKKTKWETYRQELRDLPESITEVGEFFEWPEEPENLNNLPQNIRSDTE